MSDPQKKVIKKPCQQPANEKNSIPPGNISIPPGNISISGSATSSGNVVYGSGNSISGCTYSQPQNRPKKSEDQKLEDK